MHAFLTKGLEAQTELIGICSQLTLGIAVECNKGSGPELHLEAFKFFPLQLCYPIGHLNWLPKLTLTYKHSLT